MDRGSANVVLALVSSVAPLELWLCVLDPLPKAAAASGPRNPARPRTLEDEDEEEDDEEDDEEDEADDEEDDEKDDDKEEEGGDEGEDEAEEKEEEGKEEEATNPPGTDERGK